MLLRTLGLITLAVGAWAQTAAAPKPPVATAESAALKTLVTTFNDPSTNAATLDGAIATFRQLYPESAYREAVLMLGVRYHRQHSDYYQLLEYGSQVLALDPGNLLTLAALGAAIPQNVKTTDLDMDQRLAQAAGYNREVIAAASGIMLTGAPTTFLGRTYTAEQAKTLKDDLEAPAYLALARIAMIQQQYPAAVAAYQNGLAFMPSGAAQAQTYFDIGEADAAQHLMPAAQAAWTKALALNPTSELLQKLVQQEQEKIKGGQ